MSRTIIGNKVFNLALSVYIIQAVGVYSSLKVKPFLGFLTYLILLLLGLKFVLSRYTKPQLFLMVFLLSFGIWLYYITKVGDLMIFIWFIVAARDVDLRRTFRTALRVYIITMTLAVCMYLLGYATDVTKALADGTVGHSYGFINANVLSVLVFQPVLIWVFLKYDRLKIREYLLIIIVELLLYYITRCRSTLVISVSLLILLPNIKVLSSHKYSRRVLSVLTFIAPVCALLSFISVYLYSRGGVALTAMDILGSGRISNAYINISMYGMHLLPIENNPIFGSPYTLDNSYIRIGTHFGMLVLILVVYIYTRSMHFMYKREEYERLVVIAIICLLSLFETNLYRLSINIAILFLSEGLYSSGKLDASCQYQIETDM